MSVSRKQARLKFVLLSGIISLLAAALPLNGKHTSNQTATYFIDALEGNDANAGTTPQTAWKSLQKVNSTTFHAGDSILLKGGSSWEGQLWPKGSGSEGRPIRIGSYGDGPKPLIRANGKFEDAVLLKNQEYWEIQGLEVTNSGKTKATKRGVHLAVEDFGEVHHLVVRRMTIHDVSGRDDAKNNGGITFTADGEKKPSRFVGLIIEDNQIRHVDRNGISNWSDRWQRSKWFPSLGVVVRGNTLDDIGGDGIMIAVADGALIERNVVGNANQRSEGYNIAIWTWSADNSVIQYNEAYGTKGQRDGEGFDSDWNSKNTLIQYNYSHDNEGGFLLICDDGGQDRADSVGNVGTTVRYNISQNDRHRGIAFSGPVRDTLIYNNTFYIGAAHKVDAVLFTDWSGWAKNTAFYNNIFYAMGTARIGHAVARDKGTGEHTSAEGLGESETNEFDGNIYFGNINTPPDKTGLTTDPKLEAPGSGKFGRHTLDGYGLRSQSPARRSARTVKDNGGKDFVGTTLFGCELVDRGAIQSSQCEKK